MDSLSRNLDRLRVNDEYFREKFINITSVYSAPFDSDTVEQYLSEGVLKAEGNEDWVVEIPRIEVRADGLTMPTRIILNTEKGEVDCCFPETIEEFRAIAKSHEIIIQMNTQTAKRIYG